MIYSYLGNGLADGTGRISSDAGALSPRHGAAYAMGWSGDAAGKDHDHVDNRLCRFRRTGF